MSPLSVASPDALWLGMGLAVLAGAGAAVAVAFDQTAPDMRFATLRFPADLSADQVRAALDGIAGLRCGAVVRLGLLAEPTGISFDVAAAPGQLTTFERTLAGVAPGVRVDVLSGAEAADRQPGPEAKGAQLSWRSSYPLLRSDEPEVMVAALLGAVSQLRRGERLWLQVSLMPAGRVRLPPKQKADRPDNLARLLGIGRGVPVEQRRAVVAKFQLPLLRVRVRVAVQAAHPKRADQLIARVAAVVRTRCGLRGRLHVRRLAPRAMGRVWSRPPRHGDLLSSAEVTALVGWPIGAPPVQGVQYGVAPRLLPASTIPSSGAGRVFGVSTWPGQQQRRVVQPPLGATCHSLLLGPSGSGKSWLLAGLLLGDIATNASVLLDLKGDTARDVLSRIDPRRHDDVLVLEPSNGLAVPGLRCFSGEPELAADLWLNIFRGLFKDSWGVRSERYLRMAFATLARDPGASVADVPRLFADVRYRRRLVAGLSDPLLVGQWSEFDALGSVQRAEHLVSPLGKVSEIVGRRVVRSVLAQPDPKLTIRAAIERGMIVVVSLPPGRLGGPATQLLGALVVYEVFQTIMARQALDPRQRRPLGFYIDEPAVLGALPVPLDSLFETARGMNCGVTMAAQSLSQLPAVVQRAATTNAATIAAFRPGAEDASRIARELPGVNAEQLQRLEPYTVALRLGLGPGEVAPVCTASTLPLADPTGDADVLRRLSSDRHGMQPDAVDAALRARHGLNQPADEGADGGDGSGTVPLGERGRAS